MDISVHWWNTGYYTLQHMPLPVTLFGSCKTDLKTQGILRILQELENFCCSDGNFNKSLELTGGKQPPVILLGEGGAGSVS